MRLAEIKLEETIKPRNIFLSEVDFVFSRLCCVSKVTLAFPFNLVIDDISRQGKRSLASQLASKEPRN